MINYEYEIDFENSVNASITSTIGGTCKATSLENCVERAKQYVTAIEGEVKFKSIKIWESDKLFAEPIYFDI